MNTTNPLLGTNKLKLGAFNFNGDGNARTLAPERYDFNWANSLDVARYADQLRFEAIVPYARYRSVAGARHRSAHVFDTLTWASAVAASTQYSCVMSTIHVANVHPIFAAKAMATVDHVSGGRFALNMVCGWFKEEAEMCGYPFLEHDERYVYADEWISAIKRLWSEEDSFDFNGKHITIKDGMSQPKPVQRPHPPLMNAGGSPAARQFVGKHCDIAFIRANKISDMKAEAEAYRKVAREQYGRELQVWVYCAVVQGDTDADAMAIANRYADLADDSYLESYFHHKSSDLSPEVIKEKKRQYAAAGTGVLLMGDAEKLAHDLQAISDAGVDGVLLTWVDFQNGIRRFGKEVLPLVEQCGLRSAR